MKAGFLIFALGALTLTVGCSGDDGPADAGPQFDLPQILPERAPLCLNYELTLVNSPRTFPIAVRNEGRQQLVIASSRVEGDDRGHFSLQGPDQDVVETYDTALFQLTYQPSVAGWDDATVVIESNAQNFPRLRIAVLARAVPEMLDAGPSEWDAGPKPPEALSDGGETCPPPDAGM